MKPARRSVHRRKAFASPAKSCSASMRSPCQMLHGTALSITWARNSSAPWAWRDARMPGCSARGRDRQGWKGGEGRGGGGPGAISAGLGACHDSFHLSTRGPLLSARNKETNHYDHDCFLLDRMLQFGLRLVPAIGPSGRATREIYYVVSKADGRTLQEACTRCVSSLLNNPTRQAMQAMQGIFKKGHCETRKGCQW